MTSDDGSALDGAELDEALGAARVSVKGVRRDHARAAIAEALFGGADEPVETIGPARLDRFVILDKLGHGGMGVVYAAYDPELDRRVAVKVLQSGRQTHDAEARARLLREAQALARLSHPNVVPVHDVGVIDDQVYIVMEFVIGRDLRAWQAGDVDPVGDADGDAGAGKPSWRDILDVYRQAGEGLAAAHEAGLVHRDFKPENAIVGADGRVRVLDFGLARGGVEGGDADGDEDGLEGDIENGPGAAGARAGRARSEPVAAAAQNAVTAPGGPVGERRISGEYDTAQALLDVPMTVTGAFMGTPAYMSPEQFAGGQVGQASDQFSFCVALHEALYGERPYQGQTLAELGARLTAGDMVEVPRAGQVPGWLWPIVRRGLATRPDDRYPSMAALLAALASDPARTRRRWLLVGAALALAGLSAAGAYAVGGASARPSAAEQCANAGRDIAVTWSAEQRAAVRAAITATGHAYAEQAAALVADKLDGYASRWADMRVEACVRHKQNLQSDALFDRRMSCLARRRDALASAVAVLRAPDAEAIDKTVLVAEKLPSIEYCGNVAALEAEVPPPEDPAVAARVEELRRILARAKVEEDAGRHEQPLAMVDDVLGVARQLDYQPLVAEALLAKGRITMQSVGRLPAIAVLSEAALVGFRAHVDPVALEALARRMWADGTTREDAANALIELPMALALAERIPDSEFVSALLLNNAGVVAYASSERDHARAHYQRALEFKRKLAASSPLELVNIVANLAMVADDLSHSADLMVQAQDEFAAAVGAQHPLTLIAQLKRASYTRAVEPSLDLTDRACESMYRLHRNQLNMLTDCLYYSGMLRAEAGRPERARQRFATLAGLIDEHRSDTYYARFFQLARGYEQFYGQAHAGAIEAFEGALALLPDLDQQPWWLQLLGADALRGIGMSALPLGDRARAIASLRRSIALFEQITQTVSRVEFGHQLALARLTLARALAAAGDPVALAEARTQGELARAWYLGDAEGHARRLQELDSYGPTGGFQVLK